MNMSLHELSVRGRKSNNEIHSDQSHRNHDRAGVMSSAYPPEPVDLMVPLAFSQNSNCRALDLRIVFCSDGSRCSLAGMRVDQRIYGAATGVGRCTGLVGQIDFGLFSGSLP